MLYVFVKADVTKKCSVVICFRLLFDTAFEQTAIHIMGAPTVQRSASKIQRQILTLLLSRTSTTITDHFQVQKPTFWSHTLFCCHGLDLSPPVLFPAKPWATNSLRKHRLPRLGPCFQNSTPTVGSKKFPTNVQLLGEIETSVSNQQKIAKNVDAPRNPCHVHLTCSNSHAHVLS